MSAFKCDRFFNIVLSSKDFKIIAAEVILFNIRVKSGVGSKSQELSPFKSDTGPVYKRARTDQRKRQATPDW